MSNKEKANKMPAFQFYPGDWMKDPNLRRCSFGAKGLWMDLLCIMFENEDRGCLVDDGVPWSEAEVIQAIGGDKEEATKLFRELLQKKVCKIHNDGYYYSSRMVNDQRIRQIRIEAGSKGGNPNLIKAKAEQVVKDLVKQKGKTTGLVKQKAKQNLTPSSSSSSSTTVINKNGGEIFAHWSYISVQDYKNSTEEFKAMYTKDEFDLFKKFNIWIDEEYSFIRKQVTQQITIADFKRLNKKFTRVEIKNGFKKVAGSQLSSDHNLYARLVSFMDNPIVPRGTQKKVEETKAMTPTNDLSQTDIYNIKK